jgi:hypothetical protein
MKHSLPVNRKLPARSPSRQGTLYHLPILNNTHLHSVDLRKEGKIFQRKILLEEIFQEKKNLSC